ncbi:MAG: glycoside hydrolase family 3 N-terminal domain-containing protein, partial [Flavicella sp.]|nr:glycoside hydrolase family 3 N-terminal domain-containing protein [Flavicella sp.]
MNFYSSRKSIPYIFFLTLLTISFAPVQSQINVQEIANKSIGGMSKETDTYIEQIVKELSLTEKVALCHAQSKFSTKGVPRLGIPEIWMADGPHGVRAEMSWDSWNYAQWANDSITAFPALTCLAASFDPQLSNEYGLSLGEEARYREKDVLLGPGVNIYRTPMNGRNFEYLGEDPFLASKMVVPYIQGVQKNGVAACVKHFALNNQERWRDVINVEVNDRALYEIYLPAFKAAVMEAGVWSIMGAYNKFRGQYACHNELLLNKILKNDWGFDGVVISDWSGAHSTLEAALYGLDLEMGTGTDGLGTTTDNHYEHYYLAKP